MGDPVCCPVLDGFMLILVWEYGLHMGRHTLFGALLVFCMLSDVCLCVLYVCFNVVAQCHICFGGHILDVLVPAYVFADFKPMVYCL